MGKQRIFGVITGKSGTGKSELIKRYIIPKLLTKKPVFIFDVLNEYEGDEMFLNFDAFFEYLEEKKEIENKKYVIKWRSDETVIDAIKFFRFIEQPVALVFEEAHELFSKGLYTKLKKELNQITKYGRHFEIDVIFCTQRPKDLSTNIRSQAQFFTSFLQTEEADLDYLEKYNRNFSKNVGLLKKFNYISEGNIPTLLKNLKENKKMQL
jgi:DNA helicase HerA-like ATPase